MYTHVCVQTQYMMRQYTQNKSVSFKGTLEHLLMVKYASDDDDYDNNGDNDDDDDDDHYNYNGDDDNYNQECSSNQLLCYN